MKNGKKILSLLLAVVMTLSATSTAAAASSGLVSTEMEISVAPSGQISSGTAGSFVVSVAKVPTEGLSTLQLDYQVFSGTIETAEQEATAVNVTQYFTHDADNWAEAGSGAQGASFVSGQNSVGIYNANLKTNGPVWTMHIKPAEGLVGGTYTIRMKRVPVPNGGDSPTCIMGCQNTRYDPKFVYSTFTLNSTVTEDSVTPSVTVTGTKSYDYATTPPTPEVLTATATVATTGTLSYQWYTGKGESKQVISGESNATYTPALPSLGGSQDYTCVVTNTYNGQTFTGEDSITVTYNKGVISAIEATGGTTYTYTGQAQGPSGYTVKDANGAGVAQGEYELSGTGSTSQTNVGTYTTTATAKDTGNYTGNASVTWSIDKANYKVTGSKMITIYSTGAEFTIGESVLTVKTANDQAVSGITYSGSYTGVVVTSDGKLTAAKGTRPGTFNVTVTIPGDTNHNATTETIAVTVQDKTDISDSVSFAAQSGADLTYNPNGKQLSTYVGTATCSTGGFESATPKYLVDGVEKLLSDTVTLDAGEHTITAVFEDATNYGAKEVKITIEKAEITPTVTWKVGDNAYSAALTYDGMAKTITPTVTPEQAEVVPGTGCTATDAGNYTANATVQIKSNYAQNYKLATSFTAAVTQNWEIAKATNNLSATVAEQSVRYNDSSVKTIAASAITFTGTAPAGVEIKSVTPGTDSSSIIADNYPKFDETSKTAQYQLKGAASFTAGQSYTFTIGYSTTNYEDGTVQVTVTVVDKYIVDDQVSFSPEAPTTTYNGAAQTVSATAATFTGRADGAGAITYKYNTGAEGAWSDTAPTNAGTYKVQATYEDNSQRGKAEATYTINKAPLTITGATVTAKDYDTTTAAAVSAVTFGGTKGTDALALTDDYTVTGAFDNANAGENKSVNVTVALLENGPVSKNYTLPTATFTTTGTINKKSVTPTVTLDPVSFTFNNTEQKPDVTVKFTDGSEITMDAKEYTVAYGGDCTNAGAVTVTVTASAASNYVFSGPDGKATATYTITPATLTLDDVKKSYKAGAAVTGTATLPTLTNPGTVSSTTVGAVTGANTAIIEGTPTIADGVLSYQIAASGTAGQTATIPVTIVTQNYGSVTVNVVITLTDKNVPTVSANDITKVYDGQDLSGITGTATFNGVTVPGAWSVVSPAASAVKNASATAYNVTVKFTPENTTDYAEVEDQITVTINKATPTVTATCTPITTAGKTLADATISCSDTPSGGSIAWDDPADTAVVANQSYGWTYTPADTTNYETVTGTLIPFVQQAENPDDDVNYPVTPPVIVDPLPGNGGGGNQGGNHGGTTTNPNEPVTNTTTDSQGNVTTTTTYPDGSETKVEKKVDGTVITTEVDPEGNKSSTVENTDGSTMTTVENVDGSSSFVSTDANGKTSAVVELPAKTVEDANTTGRPAALPMDSVTATTDSATAPVVTVNTANEEPVKVEIPVSNAGNGTVAVLVKADGTEEIIKTTIPTADGIAVTLNSGESVKVVDNSKYFSDTARHWGSDAVDFVSARELFGGTGENKFSPDDAMTRGMLMTVLARFENVDTAGGATWYEKGVAWAVTQGLSDGTNPNGRITREQLATIIYRYAQSKGVNTTAGGSLERFPDAGRVSDWAMEAMSWCVAEGIISGVGGATLDPTGNATRAQVATIIMRYAEKFAA